MLKDFWQDNCKGDRTIWAVFLFLILLSIVEVYSATSSLAYGKVYNGDYNGPIMRHIKLCIGGLVAAFFFHSIDIRRHSKLITFLCWPALLGLVMFTSLKGTATNGAARWSSLPLIGQFQPTELLKLAYVIAVGYCFSAYYKDETKKKRRRWLFFLTASTSIAIFSENGSNGFIVLITFTLIQVLFHNKRKAFVFGVGIALLVVWATLVFARTEVFQDLKKTKVTQVARIGTMLSRIERFANEKEPGEPGFVINGDNYQAVHGRIAIANSRGIGLGPGRSIERDYLPQAYSDFIYALIVEEMGIVGGFSVILAYLILLFHIGKIVARCNSMFSTITASGLGLMLIIQALINTGVAVGLLPVTGQPLPLVSRGGTSIVVVSMYFGILLSITRFDCDDDTATEAGKQNNESAEAPTPA